MPRKATDKTINVPPDLWNTIAIAARDEAVKLNIPKMAMHTYLRILIDKEIK